MRGDRVLDLVDRRFSAASPDLPNGFAEHTPMGVEAMIRLGLDADVVLAWSERHHPEMDTADSPRSKLRTSIEDELSTGDWRMATAAHVARLADRCDAHLFHGLIRCAHAVRAIAGHDSPSTRSELAAGVAAWSAWAGSTDDLPHLAGDADTPDGFSDPDRVVLDAAVRGAAAFVRSPSIFTLHAVTGPMAWTLLSPMVDDDTRRSAARSFVRSHRRHPPAEVIAERTLAPPTDAELLTLADQWDAHPAKLVEAALRGHAATGHPVFLAAVREVL